MSACCTSEDRNNECATCDKRWCDPENVNCPFHEDNPMHDQYCGKTDQAFIDFLKMLRYLLPSC